MSRWSIHKLGDFIHIKHGYAFKGKDFVEEPTGLVVVTPGNFAVGGGFKNDKPKWYARTAPRPPDYILSPHDLIVTMTDLSQNSDTLGYGAIVPEDQLTYLHNQRIGLVQIQKPGRIDKNFLHYLMRSDGYRRQVIATASGTTVHHTSPGRIQDATFALPSLGTQCRIAEILGRLDDKIELNRRLSRKLDEMAQALYKHHFVDSGPYQDGEFVESELGLIPKGWDVNSLDAHIRISKGLSYKGESLADEGMPLHNLNSIYEGGGYKYAGIKFYSGKYQEKHLVKPGDLIVANTEQGFDYLLIGCPAIVPERFGKVGLFTHHIYKVEILPNSPLATHYLYYWLKDPQLRQAVTAFTNGTTVNMLSREGLQIPLLVIPPRDIVQNFDRIASNVTAQIELGENEIRKLAEIRDYLLPKLLSGEIEV